MPNILRDIGKEKNIFIDIDTKIVLSLVSIDAFHLCQTENGCGKDSSHVHTYFIVFKSDQQGETYDRSSWDMRVRSVGLEAAWECLWRKKNLLVTVRTLVLTSAVMYIRPLLSVWSVPHRLGTLATQRLWMFIIQSAGRDREKGQVHSHSVFYNIQSQSDRSTYVHISCPGVWGRRAENHSGRRRWGWSRCEF